MIFGTRCWCLLLKLSDDDDDCLTHPSSSWLSLLPRLEWYLYLGFRSVFWEERNQDWFVHEWHVEGEECIYKRILSKHSALECEENWLLSKMLCCCCCWFSCWRIEGIGGAVHEKTAQPEAETSREAETSLPPPSTQNGLFRVESLVIREQYRFKIWREASLLLDRDIVAKLRWL